MATQVWPSAGVPNKPLWNTYSEQLRDFNSEFQPDVGPPSRWPRSSAAMLEASWRLRLDAAQRLALLAFYVTTCKGGALPFTLDDPQDGTSYTWFWTSPPTINSVGGKLAFNAEIRVRRLI